MTRYKPLLLLMLSCAVSQFALATPGEDAEEGSVVGTLHGYVTDAETHKPVAGVTVTFASAKRQHEIVSDSKGHFRFAKLPPGELVLIFEKKGYKMFKRELVPARHGAVNKIAVAVQKSEDDGGMEMWHPLLKLLD